MDQALVTEESGAERSRFLARAPGWKDGPFPGVGTTGRETYFVGTD